MALSLVAMAAASGRSLKPTTTATNATVAKTPMIATAASLDNTVASTLAQSAKELQAKAAKASKASQRLTMKESQATKELQPTKDLPAKAMKEPQDKAAAEFIKLDAATLPIIKKIQIGGDADWLAIGFGSVWVTVAKNNEVVRVDPVRDVVQARIAVDKEPCYGIGIGVDHVWVLNCQGKTLTRINHKTNAVDMRVPVKIDDSGEGSIAVDERYVWYASNEDGHSSTLSQVEVKTGRKLKGIAVGKDTGVVKLAFGSVWAISSGEGNLYRVDPATKKVTAMITVAEGPRFTTEGGGSLWVLTQSDGNVSRIDPATNKVVAVIPVHVPGKGGEISYGGGFIWVTMDGNPVTRIDPATNKVIDQYGNYPKADAIRYGFGSVWVSDHGKGELWKIDPGKMRGR
jgi:DNA-binding beta-propeller fold protein YncE